MNSTQTIGTEEEVLAVSPWRTVAPASDVQDKSIIDVLALNN